MRYLRAKGLLLTLITVATTFGVAGTTANAKTIWTFGNGMKSIRTAPKSIRGTWYGYTSVGDKHASKLSIHQKSFTVSVQKPKSIRKLSYAKNWRTAYKVKNMPNIDLRKESHGWYYFAINPKYSWELPNTTFYSGMLQPVKYGHTKALAYYPTINEKKNKVLLLTKKKYKHPVYKSTKHLTIVNLYGGK